MPENQKDIQTRITEAKKKNISERQRLLGSALRENLKRRRAVKKQK
tara:strand:+ start:85 stop:222 length:138 start_codon:yes stop_codon:yes gene_type:complete